MLEFDTTKLDALVTRVVGQDSVDMSSMPGGASTRKYFRVWAGNRTMVAMFVPDGDTPEEIGKDADAPEKRRWPFLEVRDLLGEHKIDVPRILGEDTKNGWLLIEDLGDDTLANYLLRNPDQKRACYTRAVTDLAKAQKALDPLPPESIVSTRSFDEDLLRWEIDHFREWALEARGHQLSDDDRKVFDGVASRLAKKIASWPQGFVHRDYQSRNLMVRENGSLVWLDFQDALLGPRIYDLVALLGDSYQEFDREFVLERLNEYAVEAGLSAKERKALPVNFDTMTVQRKLKDAGRFVFIDRKKRNPSFLRFVVPTIKKVGAALSRLKDSDKDMAALDALLHRLLPDEI